MTRLTNVEQKLKGDFPLFADIIFKETLQLGGITDLQRDFCETLQKSKADRLFLSCFRGFGKSYLLALFAVWTLYNDPDEKIIVVSASSPRSKDFVRFCKDVILKTPLLEGMISTNRRGQDLRTSIYSFDCVGSKPSQFASLKAVGITGQVTGSRATMVIYDDVEISTNSQTETARFKLAEAMKESNALLLPKGKIMIIGTPQSRFSIYNSMDGFKTFKYPIYYPDPNNYKNLAPFLAKKVKKNKKLLNTITEKERFSEDDINSRHEAYGKSQFQLQYQLDTTLLDELLFPLQARLLRICNVGADKAYTKYKVSEEFQSKGYTFTRAIPSTKNMFPFDQVICSIDTAGKGICENSSTILKTLGGNVFIADSINHKDGFTDETFKEILLKCRKHGVSLIVVESNYSNGLWANLLIKHLKEEKLAIGVEEIFSKGKKSKRIVASIEPFLTAGKLYADRDWWNREMENPHQNLFQQLESQDPESLTSNQDDRADSLALGLAHLQSNLGVNEERADHMYRTQLLEMELESVIHSQDFFSGKTDRGNFGSWT